MPWTGGTFARKHNHKLSGEAASTAAAQATAMVKKGVPEGIAIATANKTGNRKRREKLYDHPRSKKARDDGDHEYR